MSLSKELRDSLLKCADVIMARYPISLDMLGRRVSNSTTFFDRVKARDTKIFLETAEEALAWFSHHWPKDEPWPGDFRPDKEFTRSVMKALPPKRQMILIPRVGRKKPTALPKKRNTNRHPNTLPG